MDRTGPTVGRKYQKPPLVEALCELHLAGSAWDDTIPGLFYERVRDRFPIRRQKGIGEAQVSISASGETSAIVRQMPPWIQFLSNDESRMIQLARDLLVVNQMPPYPHYEGWEPVIVDALETYRAIASPERVVRLGVRYINRVVIPGSRIRMEDYFEIYPHLPSGMGDAHGPFMVRVEIPADDVHTVLVTFATAPTASPDEVAHLLEIVDIIGSTDRLRFDTLAHEIRIAHGNVEAAFEGSIKDKLRELFVPEGD